AGADAQDALRRHERRLRAAGVLPGSGAPPLRPVQPGRGLRPPADGGAAVRRERVPGDVRAPERRAGPGQAAGWRTPRGGAGAGEETGRTLAELPGVRRGGGRRYSCCGGADSPDRPGRQERRSARGGSLSADYDRPALPATAWAAASRPARRWTALA